MRKVALVTGGASGIGRAACLEFAKHGIAVVIADKDEAAAQATLEEVSAVFAKSDEASSRGSAASPANPAEAEAGGSSSSAACTFCKTDVCIEEDVKALMEHIRSTYGRLDYCLDNAGVEGIYAPTADHPVDEFDKVMSVNARGVFLCLKHQIPLMLETAAGHGAIVITSSVAGVTGLAGLCAYTASKHAVVGMMRCAAAEYGPLGLRVNCINPGAVDTPLLSRFASSLPEGEAATKSALTSTYPLRRMASAQEIGEAAVWVCTKATYMTGHTLVLDGGSGCT